MTIRPESDLRDWISASGVSSAAHDEIQAEAQYILSHSCFRNSRRCVTLFRYLVDCFLKDDQDSLKERVLGVAVFGRNPDYDSNADPIVRIAANEVRKRLAQCYEERDSQSSIRIHLVPGSYQLQIERLHPEPAKVQENALVDVSPSALHHKPSFPEPEQRPSLRFRMQRLRWFAIAAAACCVVGAALFAWYEFRAFPNSSHNAIWAPLLQGSEPIMICINDRRDRSDAELGHSWAFTAAETIATRNIPNLALSIHHVPATSIVDARVAARVMAILSGLQKDSSIQGASSVTLADLRHNSDVLVGAFDNPWSLVLLSQLRYHVMIDPNTEEEWIEDRDRPGQKDWSGSGKLEFSESSTDYALITRYKSPDTGSWILAIGGLGMHGTEAAGELISNANLLKSLPHSIQNDQCNFQLVIKTTVLGGHTGPPQIVASYVW
jgi:hypothetical protein